MNRTLERFGKEVRLIKANIDNPSNEEFVKTVGVTEVPTAIVVSRSGERIRTLSGASECLSLNTILNILLPEEGVVSPVATEIPAAPRIALLTQSPQLDTALP